MRLAPALVPIALLLAAGCQSGGMKVERAEVWGADGQALAAPERLVSFTTDIPFGGALPITVSGKGSSEARSHVIRDVDTTLHLPPPPAPRARTPVLGGLLAYLVLVVGLALIGVAGQGRRRARARAGLAAAIAIPVVVVASASVMAPPKLIIDNASWEALTVRLGEVELPVPARHFIEVGFAERESQIEVLQGGVLRERATLRRSRSLVAPVYVYNCLGKNRYRVGEARYRR